MTKERLLVTAMLAGVLVLTAVCGVAVAQGATKPITVTVTLSAEQVDALAAYHKVMSVPPSQTPSTVEEWVTAHVRDAVSRLLSDADRHTWEALLSDVRALTPEKRKALQASLETIKKQGEIR